MVAIARPIRIASAPEANMVTVRIEDKPGFGLIGVKTWIAGTDNAQFARFWTEQGEKGVIDRLARLKPEGVRSEVGGQVMGHEPHGATPVVGGQIMGHEPHGAPPVVGGQIMGLSDTTKNPRVREFDFYIGVEVGLGEKVAGAEGFERIEVQPYQWAIFGSPGTGIEALMECEMHCGTEWLPNNLLYEHDNGPELEVYYEDKIEYWVPIKTRI
jgi:predicted transcriptional regulator YdeE